MKYRIRILYCIIAAELIAIGFFTLWPIPGKQEGFQDIDFSDEVIALEDVVRTRQQNQPASPPKPQVPIPVPNDRIIEEEEITFDNINITDFSDSLAMQAPGNQGESDRPMSNPQVAPSVIRIVEPSLPEAVKNENLNALIYVDFLVNVSGKVEEASIAEIKVRDKQTGNATTVQTIGYGLTEAVLNAALQWRFRPAKHDGNPVRAYTEHTFTIGEWN